MTFDEFAEFERVAQANGALAASPPLTNRHGSLPALSLGEFLQQSHKSRQSAVEGLLDLGDKLLICGPPKSRKSFLAAQLALCLGAGIEFLGMPVPQPRKVLLVQFEVKPDRFRHRLSEMSKSLIAPERIKIAEENVFVSNLRGLGYDLTTVLQLVVAQRPEIVIFDPIYLLLEGDENDNREMKRLTRFFDEIASHSGSVIFVHHDAKGGHGRVFSDRGSGSGVINRTYDSAIFINEQAGDSNSAVLSFSLRNSAPRCCFSPDRHHF